MPGGRPGCGGLLSLSTAAAGAALVFALSTWQSCVHVLRQAVVPTALLSTPLTSPFFSTFCTLHSSCRRRTRVIFFLYTLSPFCYVKKSKVWSHAVCVQSVWCVCVCVCPSGSREMSCVSECSQQSAVCVDAGCATVSVRDKQVGRDNSGFLSVGQATMQAKFVFLASCSV